jgi:hypothetical protein
LHPPHYSPLGRLAATWGILGVFVILGRAIAKVGVIALEASRGEPFTLAQTAFAVGWVGFMAYSEGYRGFQLRFAPRVVARAAALAREPTLLRSLLAPLFVIGYFAGTRRRLITAWGVTLAIVGVVVVVRDLAQPWRGIVDGGVVVGLGWGTAALAWFSLQALLGRIPLVDPQLPDKPAA